MFDLSMLMAYKLCCVTVMLTKRIIYIVQHVHSHSSEHIQLFQDRDTTRVAMQTTASFWVPQTPYRGLAPAP